MPNILIAGCMHASGTGDYLLSNDLIMFLYSRSDEEKEEVEERSDCLNDRKVVNGAMIFNGNFHC